MSTIQIKNPIYIRSIVSILPTQVADGSFETKFDVVPYLKDRKMKKFLSKQDELSMAAAGEAWKKAGIDDANFSESTGIYLCVGILPFEDAPIKKIAQLSQKDGVFDLQEFSTTSFNAMNPLLTFKCLPNMPLFHISYNLEITGRYHMTYPGVPEWFGALGKAIDDLQSGIIDYAIVGATADQKNFLVRHHVRRICPEQEIKLADTASVMVLSTKKTQNDLALIKSLEYKYQPFDPREHKNDLLPNEKELSFFPGVVGPSLIIDKKIHDPNCQGTFEYKWSGPLDNMCKIMLEKL